MTREMVLEYVIEFLTLVSGRIPLNICKVFTVAFIAGAFLGFACVDGAYTFRALFVMLVCVLMACFFGTLTALGMEMEDCYAEDDL